MASSWQKAGYYPRKAEPNLSGKYFCGNLQDECLDMNFTKQLAPLVLKELWTPKKLFQGPFEYNDV